MKQLYRKKLLQPMRPYVVGEDLSGISVNAEDTPEEGGMIAWNPDNPKDMWYVAKKFFEENYEPVISEVSIGSPTVGRNVHYVSYGTPGGEYPQTCRAAIITAVNEWDGTVDLAVMNPTGMFFNQNVMYDPDLSGGTWHWPERV